MSEMITDWERLVAFGPKPAGSQTKRVQEAYLLERARAACADTALDEFVFDGWRLTGESALCVVAPARRALDACLFWGSGQGRCRGTLKRLGLNHVWNIYAWDRYAICDGETIAGYLSGRPEGGVLSQTQVEGCDDLPHFIVGREDNAWIRERLDKGERVTVEGVAACEAVRQRGANIIMRFAAPASPKKGLLVTAHTDTMYNTPGAYDNQSGTAVVLEMARRLSRERPQRDITLLLTDGEEAALAGSRHYAERCALDGLAWVLNIDGVGGGSEMEVWCGPQWFERRVERALRSEPTPMCYRNPPPPGSDHTPFYLRGLPVCMLTFNDQGVIHTPRDVCRGEIAKNMETMLNDAMKLIGGCLDG